MNAGINTGMPQTIGTASAALAAGRTTARALVDESLATIARLNAETNAFITVAADRARARADELDRVRAKGLNYGPLHGIPISLKDIIDQAGIVTTAASHVLDDRVADSDAALVSRLEEAGAIVIGRTNLHQFALGTTSDDSAYGPVRNPYDTTRAAGGSSGGSAVAVATGMGLASVGTDTGASIRVPAALCGVVGLKATSGEIPTTGVIPLSTTLDHAGPLTQSVQDAAWMWQVMSGRPTVELERVSLERIRLAELGGYFSAVTEPGVRRAYRRGCDVLTAAGVRLSAVEIPDPNAIGAAYATIVLAEAAWWHAPYLDSRASGYSPTVHDRIARLGRAVSATAYLDALAQCRRLARAVDALFDNADALILPTLPIVAPTIGATEIVVDPADATPQPVRAVMLRLTQLFNLTGHPAISVPLPTQGLPVGLQIVGRRHGTAELLAIAAAVESALARAPQA